MSEIFRWTLQAVCFPLTIGALTALAQSTGTIDFNTWLAQQPAAQPAASDATEARRAAYQ